MLLAGLDVARPAAQEQLVLGEEVGVDSLQPVFETAVGMQALNCKARGL